MSTKRLGRVLLLASGFCLLILLARNTDNNAYAGLPVQASPTSSTFFLPFVARNYTPPAPLYRFGITRIRRTFSAYSYDDIAPLRLGWYINFGVNSSPERLYGMEYVPNVRVKQWKVLPDGTPTLCCVGCEYQSPATYSISPSLSTIKSIASARRGMTWIVGNEMERIDWPEKGSCGSQDEMLPELYAQVYHEVYTAIKSADPTAQVAFGPLVQPSDLRIQWLDRVWQEYDRLYGNGQVNTMPVDVWTIHVYVYREQKDSWGADIPAGLAGTEGDLFNVADHKNFSIAAQMVVNWRTWMKNHGQQNKPLINPEYGVIFPEWVDDPPGTVLFSPPQVRDEFMYPSFDYFLNHVDYDLGFPADGYRLVQRWAWWSLDYDGGQCIAQLYYPDHNSNLLYSGLGPRPPVDCTFPVQGRSPFWTYWTQYVQSLPAASSKPYSSAAYQQPAASPQFVGISPNKAAIRVDWPATANCTDASTARAQLFEQRLPSDTAGRSQWLTALSALTPGARICQP